MHLLVAYVRCEIEYVSTLYEVCRGVRLPPPGVIRVLLGSVQDVQSCLHGPNQLIPVIPPHRPLSRVPGQPHFQLVNPAARNKNITLR